MNGTPEQDALRDLVLAIDDVLGGMTEAQTAIAVFPDGPHSFGAMNMVQRLAARALLKCVEQAQDLIARSMRAILVLEQIDMTGLSPRAIADQAVSLGIIFDGDRWSALVRLRNMLVHEYPLARPQQYARFADAWNATDDLRRIAGSVEQHARNSLNVRFDHDRL